MTSSRPVVTPFTVPKTEMLKAKALWVLKCVTQHWSYKSCENISTLFRERFPDSAVAEQFTCGEKKTAYLCCFGLAPHFKTLLKDNILNQDSYVLLFDKSLNSKTQMKQMDIHIRTWSKNFVRTRYYQSVFVGHAG